MEQNDDSEMLLRQYLLGELGEEKQRQLEGQFLTDDSISRDYWSPRMN